MDLTRTILVFVLTTLLTDNSHEQPRSMTCMDHYRCVKLSRCQSISKIVYPCNENQTFVCCEPEYIINETTSFNISRRSPLFPKTCGNILTTNRITAGDEASIGQFPWMALLGYTQTNLGLAQFLCGGTIITKKYVLTAAHCVSLDPRLKLTVVRVGELDLAIAPDCETEGNETVCADPHLDILVDKITSHEHYDNVSLRNDVALIKLKARLTFTEYVQPICLPFPNDVDYASILNDKLTVSGWGKVDSGDLVGSTKLMYTNVYIWNQTKCNSSVPPKIFPVRDSQLCANGVNKQDACRGDSGGPLSKEIPVGNDLKSYQFGIVSFSSTQICGNPELPTIYTRVDYYLDWIVDNVK